MAGAAVNFDQFEETIDTVVNDLTSQDDYNKGIGIALKRYEKNLRYSINSDHKIWISSVMMSYSEVSRKPVTQKDMYLACMLGWCYSMIVMVINAVDDIEDEDEFRYGKPTWYSLNKNRPLIVNDAVLVTHVPYILLHKYFGKHPMYPELLHCIHQMLHGYFLGSSLDLQITKAENPDMSRFTWDNYRAFYDIHSGPIFAGGFELSMILAGCPEESSIRKNVRAICMGIGAYWRIQDDINDSFGKDHADPLKDKDIKNGACRWPILKAKECASPEQWNALVETYGVNDNDKVDLVKKIFVELGVPEKGKLELLERHKELDKDINELISNGHKIGNSVKGLFKAIAACKYY